MNHNSVPCGGYPAETAEAFCEGHVAAFGFFGGIPVSVLYDNTRLLFAEILRLIGKLRPPPDPPEPIRPAFTK